jgi:hypothetical protein
MFLCQKPDFIIWIIVDIWEHFLKLTHYKFLYNRLNTRLIMFLRQIKILLSGL